MRIIADFHTHSRFARACSSNITLTAMAQTAQQKGIQVIGTGDFTHGTWLSEIESTLVEDDQTGLFRLRDDESATRFMLSTEVCTISSVNQRSKRIHHIILADNLESVKAINQALSRYGSLDSDGRPMLSVSAPQLVEQVLEIESDAFIFPAHAWTPYFGALGALSGFNTIKEAYEDQEKHIHALETGLSSDNPMNWRVSALDKYALISNSDMHSLPKMGREANQFELDKVSYSSIIGAIKNRDNKKFVRTVEFYPEEGKYHLDGHRDCSYSVDPGQNKEGRCPKCGKKLTIGVLHRVNELADRPSGFVLKGATGYVHAVPLVEVISYAMEKNAYSPHVKRMYDQMTAKIGNELDILLGSDINKIIEHSNEQIGECIKNVRNGSIRIEPGYDGVFGVIDLLNKKNVHDRQAASASQKALSDFS